MRLSVYSISHHALQSPLVLLCRNREWKGLGFSCGLVLGFVCLFVCFVCFPQNPLLPDPGAVLWWCHYHCFFFHPFSSTHLWPGSCSAHSMPVRDRGLSTIIPGIFGGPCRGEANVQIRVVDVADAEERWGLLFMYLYQPSVLFTYIKGLRVKCQPQQFCTGTCGGDLDLAVVCAVERRSQGR